MLGAMGEAVMRAVAGAITADATGTWTGVMTRSGRRASEESCGGGRRSARVKRSRPAGHAQALPAVRDRRGGAGVANRDETFGLLRRQEGAG